MIKRKPHANSKTILNMEEWHKTGIAYLNGELTGGDVSRLMGKSRMSGVYLSLAAIRAMVIAGKLKITYEVQPKPEV